MKKHSLIEDTDLISARKAAIAWKEDYEVTSRDLKWISEKYTALWETSRKQRPIFLIVGVIIGTVGAIIAAGVITNLVAVI